MLEQLGLALAGDGDMTGRNEEEHMCGHPEVISECVECGSGNPGITGFLCRWCVVDLGYVKEQEDE